MPVFTESHTPPPPIYNTICRALSLPLRRRGSFSNPYSMTPPTPLPLSQATPEINTPQCTNATPSTPHSRPSAQQLPYHTAESLRTHPGTPFSSSATLYLSDLHGHSISLSHTFLSTESSHRSPPQRQHYRHCKSYLCLPAIVTRIPHHFLHGPIRLTECLQTVPLTAPPNIGPSPHALDYPKPTCSLPAGPLPYLHVSFPAHSN